MEIVVCDVSIDITNLFPNKSSWKAHNLASMERATCSWLQAVAGGSLQARVAPYQVRLSHYALIKFDISIYIDMRRFYATSLRCLGSIGSNLTHYPSTLLQTEQPKKHQGLSNDINFSSLITGWGPWMVKFREGQSSLELTQVTEYLFILK